VDDLIIRVLSGNASPFELERLSRWRDESWENDAYYQDIAQLWELTAPEPQAVSSRPPSISVILQAAAPRASVEPSGQEPLKDEPVKKSPEAPGRHEAPEERKRGARPPWRVWGLLAASVAALAIGIQAVGRGGPGPLAEYLAPAGETRNVTLHDGSFVRLGDGSRLRVWEDGETREVSLEGRAFFAVTRDESRPFVVRTGPGEIRVLGTRFEVVEDGNGVRAVVVEGRVAVSNEIGSVEVTAGSVARMKEGETPTAEVAADLWSLLDWPNGILVFQDTPLSQVVEEVSRHFDRPLVVSDPSLGSRRITAWFQWEPFEEVAEALCMVVGASCTQAEAGVSIAVLADGGEVR